MKPSALFGQAALAFRCAAWLVPLLIAGPARAAANGPTIEVAFSARAHAAPVTGRVYVAISRDDDKPPIATAWPGARPVTSWPNSGTPVMSVCSIGGLSSSRLIAT